jgi:hypothetical protein
MASGFWGWPLPLAARRRRRRRRPRARGGPAMAWARAWAMAPGIYPRPAAACRRHENFSTRLRRARRPGAAAARAGRRRAAVVVGRRVTQNGIWYFIYCCLLALSGGAGSARCEPLHTDPGSHSHSAPTGGDDGCRVVQRQGQPAVTLPLFSDRTHHVPQRIACVRTHTYNPLRARSRADTRKLTLDAKRRLRPGTKAKSAIASDPTAQPSAQPHRSSSLIAP